MILEVQTRTGLVSPSWWILLSLVLISVDALSFLVKTSETFKLAELQLVEASLQGCINDYSVSKVLVDRSTGSTLLRLENVPSRIFDNQFPPSGIFHDPPSSLKRCDWALEIIHQSGSAEELLEWLRNQPIDPIVNLVQDQWTLEYRRFESVADSKQSKDHTRPPIQKYSMKTLLSAVSHAIPSTSLPALDPQQVKERLLLVDAKCAEQPVITLGRMVEVDKFPPASPLTVSKKWARRPFQYSSAMNIQVAEIVIDLLISMTSQNMQGSPTTAPTKLKLLDPTCGSGTFLAFALERGIQVEGYDVNPSCADGSLRNLEFLFDPVFVKANAQIQARDGSSSWKNTTSQDNIHMVVANLPWGVNSVDYVDENKRILNSTRSRLSSGIPCAFVTRDSDESLFDETGFAVIAQAHIPPCGFRLPNSKKKKIEDSSAQNSSRSRCVITIARSR